jgi:tripartite-type tricarboxylate transporter receptor subunit TctC
MNRASRILLCAAISFGAAVQVHAAEQYPNRPIRMIVPFQPGGASDFVARIIEPKLARELGQNVIIENRVGASGYVGVEVASQATPDGYTLLLGNIGTMAINASVFPKFKVKPLDAFIAVTQVVDVPTCLVVHTSLPVNSLKELIAYVKARPGKLNYSASGAGSNSRLAFEYFMQKAGLDVTMVAYKGGAGGASLGAAQGEVQMTMLTSASVLPYVRSGRLKLLAVIAPERLEAAPNVPTMPELGFPDMTVGSWQGVFVPKGTPRAVVARLFPAITRTMKNPEVVKQLATASAAVVLSNSPEDFHRFWVAEDRRWSKVVKDIGAAVQ